MPIYEYVCRKCGKRFDLLRRISDSDEEIKCPGCHEPGVKRVLSTFATSSSGGCAPAPSGGGT
ncbi:MAG: zinc ribbon domain-containing protein [Chloroflexota bacterium]